MLPTMTPVTRIPRALEQGDPQASGQKPAHEKPGQKTRIPENYRKCHLAEELERLVQLYRATGANDPAEKWRKLLDDAKHAASKAASKK